MLTAFLAFSAFSCFAEGTETSKPLTFGGYNYGDTYKNIRANTRLFCIDFFYGRHDMRVVADPLDDFAERAGWSWSKTTPSCFFVRPSFADQFLKHDVETEIWFVYPWENGVYTCDEDEGIFYAGVYEFHIWDNVAKMKEDLTEKLLILYGEPYYTGENLDNVFGKMPLDRDILRSYNDEKDEFKPEYMVWKSSANGAYAVLALWYNTNENAYKMRLAFISDYAETYFDTLENMGAFSYDERWQ